MCLTNTAAVLIFSALVAFGQERATIRTRVNLVIAPTTVVDAKGRFVDGLTAADFTVLDNGQERTMAVDTSDVALTPISLVVAVQSNLMSAQALAKIRKVGSLIEPLITGERGEAALLRYSDQTDLVEDFTSEAGRIVKAFGHLRYGGGNAVTLDAAMRGIDMLASRADNRRRILVVVSESRDRGSKVKLQDVLERAQRENVTIYPITFSVHLTPWTAKPEDQPMAGGFNWLAPIIEAIRLGKANAAEEMARFTGGRSASFVTLHGLEHDLGRIGEELHSQYLISFSPANQPGETEFRTLEVRVAGHPEYRVHTRPGYWPLE